MPSKVTVFVPEDPETGRAHHEEYFCDSAEVLGGALVLTNADGVGRIGIPLHRIESWHEDEEDDRE